MKVHIPGATDNLFRDFHNKISTTDNLFRDFSQ